MSQTNISSVRNRRSQLDRQYSLRDAYFDARTALRGNVRTVGIITFVCSVIFVAIAILLGSLIESSLAHAPLSVRMQFPIPGQWNALKMLSIMAPWISLMIIAQIATVAFVQSAVGVVVAKGAKGKTINLSTAVKEGSKRSIRTFLGILLYCAIVLSPILAVLIIGIIINWLTTGMMSIYVTLFTIGIFSALLFAIRFALIPMVALFENIPLKETLSRSRRLVSGGGVWFVVACIILMLGIDLIFSVILPRPSRESEYALLLLSIRGIIQQLFFYGIYTTLFVVFYRNQKALEE